MGRVSTGQIESPVQALPFRLHDAQLFPEHHKERGARGSFGQFELLFPEDEPGELLRRGDADFLILPDLVVDTRPKASLFEEKLVCVGCPTNKQLSRRLALEKYMSMGHVTVRFRRARRSSIDANKPPLAA
nr:hypothetical protein [Paraburkholderia sp. BL6669N2]